MGIDEVAIYSYPDMGIDHEVAIYCIMGIDEVAIYCWYWHWWSNYLLLIDIIWWSSYLLLIWTLMKQQSTADMDIDGVAIYMYTADMGIDEVLLLLILQLMK